jgi:hypothetical protein
VCKTGCKVTCKLPSRKICLYLYSKVCVTYTMMGKICVVVVKRMSSVYHFPHKTISNCPTTEHLILASRIYGPKKMVCMVINKMSLITFFKLCVIFFREMCTVMCRKCVMVYTKGRWISFWKFNYGDAEWNLQFSPRLS